MSNMYLGILGPLRVTVDGQDIEVRGARLRTLLIRLTLDAGRCVTLDSLSLALWPENRPNDSAHALQTLVSRLRQLLPSPTAIRKAPGGYCLQVMPKQVDAWQFEGLAKEGRRLLHAGEAELAVGMLVDALRLWRGEALTDVAAVPFAEAAIVRLNEMRLSAIEDRVEAELATEHEHNHLVAELEELLTVHPLRERLSSLLIRALQADGRRAEALATYERFRSLVADEFGTDPGPEIREAHLAVLRGEQVPARPRYAREGSLRADLAALIGRSEECARVAEQVRRCRLITLVGPGGVGKTRLANAVAAEMADSFPGGVWWVQLASVTDPADLLPTVASALSLNRMGPVGMPYASPQDTIGRLVETLAVADSLLVLDNCEHLLDGVARLADELLSRCSGLRVIATSLEPLAVLGEVLSPISPLPVPDEGVTPDEALRYAGVELFVNRVADLRPDFALTEDNVSATVEICRRLDGLPLAIELAAARARSLPVAQLAARLNDRFGLLAAGNRAASARHQTLRALVDWSWSLLAEPERQLAGMLAVFVGDISLDSAAGVCAGARKPPGEILDVLTALVEKSLVQFLPGPHPRYRMLETIREYCLERLAETGALTGAKRAHATYYLDVAEEAEPQLRGAGQVPWVRRLTAEGDNLYVAFHFAIRSGDGQTAVRMAAALGLFWTMRGNHTDAAHWLLMALRACDGAPSSSAYAAVTAYYLLNIVLSSGSVSADLSDAEVSALSSSGHPAAVLIEPLTALIADDATRGLAAIDRAQAHPDPWARAMLMMVCAFLQGNHGNLEGARQSLNQAVAEFRVAGERWGLAFSLTALAEAYGMLGNLRDVVEALEESVRLLQELDPQNDAVLQRVWQAVARAQQGEFDQGRSDLIDLIQDSRRPLATRDLVFARIALGDLARYLGDLDEAARQYEAAQVSLEKVASPAPLFLAILRTKAGLLAVSRGDQLRARRLFCESLTLAAGVPDMPVVAQVGVGLARLMLAHGDAASSAAILGAAHALRGASDISNPEVSSLHRDLRRALGEHAYHAAYERGQVLARADALALLEVQALSGGRAPRPPDGARQCLRAMGSRSKHRMPMPCCRFGSSASSMTE
jgi:predicted ATPase/DNA-binding SARP family transcriptional activator